MLNPMTWYTMDRIGDLSDKENCLDIYIMAPELVDPNSNPLGVGPACSVNAEWEAASWCDAQDEWTREPCTPTHFFIMGVPML